MANSSSNSGHTQYDYSVTRDLADAKDTEEAIKFTILNYMHDQLGWSYEACERRVILESERAIPKMVLDVLETRGWCWEEKRVLDVGCGQGGLVLELLERKADAWGVEPGQEFLTLSQLRLDEAGHEPQRTIRAFGEHSPFPDNHFDCVLSLQVLEHVIKPELVLEEIYRVLKPLGHCYVSCENYLSFFEPHYRVAWFPLLPKRVGSWYLRLIKRNPDFLLRYVHYTTYPRIWQLCRQIGFENETYDPYLEKLRSWKSIHRPVIRFLARIVSILPERWGRFALFAGLHANHVFRPGLTVVLRKPTGEHVS